MIKLQNILLFEDFKSQAKKFIDSGIEKGIVNSYIEKFKRIKDAKPAVAKTADIGGLEVPKGNSRFDIDKYKDFKQLEIFVDYVAGQVARVSTTGQKFDDIQVDAKPLVAANGLEIYYAKDKHACIKYRGDKPYSWCVARSDSSNMYNTYRYKENEPSFYFVKDVKAAAEEFEDNFAGEFKNPWHFFVVQATSYPDQFIVTNANNDGDTPMTWEELVDIVPKLDGLQNYFKHVPLTSTEKEQYKKFADGIDDVTFVKLSYEDKEAYLDVAIPNNELTDVQFASLPPDLKNKFIGFGIGLTDGQYEMIKSDKNLMKRYYQISIRKYKEYKKDNNNNLFLSDSEYDIILQTPEGRELIKSGGRDEMMKMAMRDSNIQKLLNIFGHDDGIIIIQNNANHFLAHSSPENIDYIFSLLSPETIKNISIHKIFNTGLNRKYGNSIPTDYINELINGLLKYKGIISREDAVVLINYNDNAHILADYFIDLYTSGKTVGFEKDLFLFFDKAGDFIKAYNAFGGKKALETIHPQYLADLFMRYFNNETVPNRRQILALISDSLKSIIRGYDISKSLISVPSNAAPENITELIQYFGGVESIQSKLGPSEIANMLRLIAPNKLDLITPLFSKDALDKLDTYKIKEFLFRKDFPIEKIAAIIGPGAIKNINDYDVYSILSHQESTTLEKNSDFSEKFIDILIKNKGPNLTFNVDNSNLSSFLMFSEDLDKIVRVFGIDKIRSMTPYDMWHVIMKHRNAPPEKAAKLLELFGKEALLRMANNIRDERHIIAQFDVYHKGAMRDLLIPYISETISPYLIAWLLNTAGDQINKYINLIGVNNVRKMDKNNVINVINSGRKENKTRALLPIFGKEYMQDIYQELGLQPIPELLQESHRIFKEYYIGS
jgi:hypothetical protein